MPRRNRRFIIATALLTVLLVGGGLQVAARLRQNQLDGALVAAVQRVDAPAVHRLLATGANPRARRTGRRSFTDLLQQLFRGKPAHGGTVECLELILVGNDMSDRTTACATDSIAADLLSHGADVETDFGYGKPLNAASLWGLHNTVEILLTRHANVNASDALSMTPLFLADEFTSERLLRAGANPNVEELRKLTPLFFAQSTTKAILLIEHGANVNHVADKLSVIDSIERAGSVPNDDPDGLIKLLRAHGALTYAELQAREKRSAKR